VSSLAYLCTSQVRLERFEAHDLRRACAKLCRKAGGHLEQIKFCWGTTLFRPQNVP